MSITSAQLKQLLEWRNIIITNMEQCDVLWDTKALQQHCNNAEFAFRMFAATYAKHLLRPNFPGQNGAFRTDMEEVVEAIDQFIRESTVLTTPPTPTHNTSPQPHPKRHRPRTMSNREIAAKFNTCSIKLICRKGHDGEVVYEKSKGGVKSGVCEVGTCSISTIKSWIRKYPDRSHAEPISGFHAGMLTDENAIDAAAKRWGDYWQEYAKSFFEWRKTHHHTPRNQFRYNSNQTILCEDIDRLAIHSHQ